MNKTAIKAFAINARKKLLSSVKDRAGLVGITKDEITKAINEGIDFAVFPNYIDKEVLLSGNNLTQRQNLAKQIQLKGYENVMEEVAYTWFNRIIAIRFMEVNNYLPTKTKVLSSETQGKNEPDIVTQSPRIELNLTEKEIQEIIDLKEKHDMDKLFQMLFIKQCNELGQILPELFESTSTQERDYTEILLDISYIKEDGVIRDLMKVDESDFLEAVEIIGWMYQYYNTQPKEETNILLKQNVKLTKERIPFVTQLFTPDWIVRYMVENSLGRLWQEGHPNEELKSHWKYYLEEALQDDDVLNQLEKIRQGYKNINPEEIKLIDPCMGSGHILVYAFDVLIQIYESCGYTGRDAAKLILEKNLYGIDIDKRAYQLAYFAVMMKARKYNRRILSENVQPNLFSIKDSNEIEIFETGAGQFKLDEIHKQTANYIIEVFKDAKEYGSILKIENRDYDGLIEYIKLLKQEAGRDLILFPWLNTTVYQVEILARQAKYMSQKYEGVITNPPYMAPSPVQADFVKKNYPDSKSDLCTVMIEKCSELAKIDGFIGMVTMHSWMFLSSFEKLRKKLMNKDAVSMAHLGARAFEEIGGEVVQTTAFVIRNSRTTNYKGTYIRLVDFKSQDAKEQAFLNTNNRHIAQQENFLRIPGMPIAYWVSEKAIQKISTGISVDIISDFTGSQHKTADNEKYLRFIWEVCANKIKNKEWIFYIKGGEFRNWYGNLDLIVDWGNEALSFYKTNSTSNMIKEKYWFVEGITYTSLSSASNSFRYLPPCGVFDIKGPSIVKVKHSNYCLGFFNSKVAHMYLKLLNPTITLQVKDVKNTPIIINQQIELFVDNMVNQNILISKIDWDSFETSWDFETHPMLNFGVSLNSGLGDMINGEILSNSKISIEKSDASFKVYEKNSQKNYTIQSAFEMWKEFTNKQFEKLKANEEELNRIFIEIYDLEDELTSGVDAKDVTITRIVDLKSDEDKKSRYVMDKSEAVKTFVSYAVGCIFGRYSPDVKGLLFAGGIWDYEDINSRSVFEVDYDNIIPVTDEEYFSDDIVARFVEFVRVVYGEITLDDNLDFIAAAIGNKGNSSREVIRNYFLKDFYKDHVKKYQKRPIYWMFDSGKENGFKALIYMHRYDRDTVGRVRTDYLFKTQNSIEGAISHTEFIIENAATSSDKAKAVKQKEKLVKQLAETKIYDQAIAHKALEQIDIDLDDGVKVNYEKFQEVEVASEGKKTQKIDLLGKI